MSQEPRGSGGRTAMRAGVVAGLLTALLVTGAAAAPAASAATAQKCLISSSTSTLRVESCGMETLGVRWQ